jgi:hypothetical protein
MHDIGNFFDENSSFEEVINRKGENVYTMQNKPDDALKQQIYQKQQFQKEKIKKKKKT